MLVDKLPFKMQPDPGVPGFDHLDGDHHQVLLLTACVLEVIRHCLLLPPPLYVVGMLLCPLSHCGSTLPCILPGVLVRLEDIEEGLSFTGVLVRKSFAAGNINCN